MQYQKRTYDLKLQEHHYEVGDFVFRHRDACKTGSSKKLNSIWMGPLVVVEVINPVLYRVRDRKREYVLHHDLIKRCEDRVIPLWLRKIRHDLMDLDTTIAYDQAEQEDEPHPDSLETSSVVTDNVTSLKESLECDLTDPMDLEEDAGAADVTLPSDDLMNPVDAMDVTPEVSIATKVTDQSQGVKANISWIDKAGDLGLKTLFSESPMVHVYAQPK